MKLNLSRTTVLISSIYTFILGVIMVVLSALSLSAHKCKFHAGFASSPESYFFHLFYYRSRHCDSFIDWSLLGIRDVNLANEVLQLTHENAIVSRTYKLSMIQLIISSILVVLSTVALFTTTHRIYFVSRKVSYFVLFFPYILMFHVSIVFDFVAGTLYADDRLRSYSIDGTMTMLEITNPNEARPFIEQIDETFRIIAPNVMFFIFTKAMVINIISCFVLFFVAYAGWEVVDGNKLRVTKKVDS